MSQKPYVYKFGRIIIKQGEIRTVYYGQIMRQTGSIEVGGFGNIPTMTSTGRVNRNELRIEMTSTGRVNRNELRIDMNSVYVTTSATHQGVNATIRRLREQEAEILDEIDAQLTDLRKRREAILKLAWKKGHTVTVKELTRLADSH